MTSVSSTAETDRGLMGTMKARAELNSAAFSMPALLKL